jgi:DNA-directed RNA polymerase subunit alpha
MYEKNWTSLIKPSALKVDNETLTKFYGKFEAKPLERGFGVTLGIALRRALLSSIRGASITSLKMDGVLHEFSTIKDVVEDVSDIILNLKEVRLKLEGTELANLKIDAQGEKDVKASDIIASDNVKILNPDSHLFTVAKGGKVRMDLTAKAGKGYVLSEENKDPNQPIGTIPIDSIFTPVKKVTFDVTNTRVGQMTNYDKLSLEIWTDGSIKPVDAISYAAKILKEQLSVFINIDEKDEDENDVISVSNESNVVATIENKNNIMDALNKRVEELELSVRAANCLANANIKYIGELVQKSEVDMLKTKNFGRKSLNEIKEILTSMKLSFGMKIDNWQLPKESQTKNPEEY